MMTEQELLQKADAFIDANMDDIIKDIKAIVDIPSVNAPAEEGAPYGKKIKRALLEALKIADRMGYKTVNCENYMGYAVGHVGNQNHIHFLLVGQQLALYVQHQITNLIKAYLRQPELFRQYPAYNLAYIDGTLIIFKQYVYDWIPGRGAGCSPVQHQRNMGYHVHIKC